MEKKEKITLFRVYQNDDRFKVERHNMEQTSERSAAGSESGGVSFILNGQKIFGTHPQFMCHADFGILDQLYVPGEASDAGIEFWSRDEVIASKIRDALNAGIKIGIRQQSGRMLARMKTLIEE